MNFLKPHTLHKATTAAYRSPETHCLYTHTHTHTHTHTAQALSLVNLFHSLYNTLTAKCCRGFLFFINSINISTK